MQKYLSGSIGRQNLLSGFLTLSVLFLIFLVFRRTGTAKQNQTWLNQNINNPMLTAQQRYNAIVAWLQENTNLTVRSSHWIAAKAAHETGRFASAIFRESNNMFGMKQPSQRQTLATGTSRGHATFRTLHENMVDYIYYLREFSNNPNDHSTLLSWVTRLKNQSYFEDTIANYYNGTHRHLPPEHRDASQQLTRTYIDRGWSTPVILKNKLML